MSQRALQGTTIERIYWEVTGQKMPLAIKRVLLPSAGGPRDMENKGRLNAQQLKDLSDELAAMSKQQSDSRLAEVFIRMSPKEIAEFDGRKGRISRIYVILSNHDERR